LDQEMKARIQSYQDLVIWQRAIVLVESIMARSSDAGSVTSPI